MGIKIHYCPTSQTYQAKAASLAALVKQRGDVDVDLARGVR